MKNKIVLVIGIMLILAMTALAAAPTVAEPTVSPSATTDRNYFKFPVTITALATGTDLNSESKCWYGVSNFDVNFAGTFSSDTNICSVTIASSSGDNDFNFRIKVQNGSMDANGTSPVAYYWRDTNSPTTTLTQTDDGAGVFTYSLSCADIATTTGNGSGCSTTKYRIDSGTWLTYGSAFNITTNGTHTIDYNSVDALGNNETMKTSTVTLSGVQTTGGPSGGGTPSTITVIPAETQQVEQTTTKSTSNLVYDTLMMPIKIGNLNIPLWGILGVIGLIYVAFLRKKRR